MPNNERTNLLWHVWSDNLELFVYLHYWFESFFCCNSWVVELCFLIAILNVKMSSRPAGCSVCGSSETKKHLEKFGEQHFYVKISFFILGGFRFTPLATSSHTCCSSRWLDCANSLSVMFTCLPTKLINSMLSAKPASQLAHIQSSPWPWHREGRFMLPSAGGDGRDGMGGNDFPFHPHPSQPLFSPSLSLLLFDVLI